MKDYYKYYVNLAKGEVIAVCRYAGRFVKGKAKCAPGDNFDPELGKTLARARAEVKVYNIKMKNANKKWAVASRALAEAKRQYNKADNYLWDASEQLNRAEMDLYEIESWFDNE